MCFPKRILGQYILVPQSLVDTISNILAVSNMAGWESLQDTNSSMGSELLLQNAEGLGQYLANTLAENNTQVVISRDSIGNIKV